MKHVLSWLAVAVSFAAAGTAEAKHCHRVTGCCNPPVACCTPQPCCAPCPAPACPEPQMVEQTVLVPELVTENRTVTVTEYREEVRERKVTVQRLVPRVETRQREIKYHEMERRVKDVTVTVCKPEVRVVDVRYTVCVPETRMERRVRTVQRPVWSEQEQEYTEMVPEVVTRNGRRCVTRCVPVVRRVTVCEDKGHWEQQAVATSCCNPCGGCASACATACAPATRCVWVPNIVQRDIEVTCHELQTAEEDYSWQETICKPEVRRRMVRVCKLECAQEEYECPVTTLRREERVRQQQICEMKPHQEVRQVAYEVCVPKSRIEDYEVTVCDCVSEEVVQTYKVCVPHEVQRECQVQVCRMVERKIMVPAPCPCPTAPTCCN